MIYKPVYKGEVFEKGVWRSILPPIAHSTGEEGEKQKQNKTRHEHGERGGGKEGNMLEMLVFGGRKSPGKLASFPGNKEIFSSHG